MDNTILDNPLYFVLALISPVVIFALVYFILKSVIFFIEKFQKRRVNYDLEPEEELVEYKEESLLHVDVERLISIEKKLDRLHYLERESIEKSIKFKYKMAVLKIVFGLFFAFVSYILTENITLRIGGFILSTILVLSFIFGLSND